MTMRVRTADWSERDRVERWREEFGRRVIRADVVATGPQPEQFAVDMTLHPGQQLAATEMRLRAVRKVRDGALFGDGADSLTLMMCRSGTVRYDTADHRHVLRSGEAVLFSHQVPVTLDWDEASIVTLQLSRAAMDGRLDGAEVGQPFGAGLHARLLRAYADVVCRAEALSPIAERHLLELARASLGDAASSGEPARRAAMSASRLEAARAIVVQRVLDPALNLDSVACTLAVSPRTLQRDFARSGTSFGAELLNARLRVAHRWLTTDMGSRHAPIGVIAFDAGFNDLSYFNRTFRAQFGCSPSEARKHASLRSAATALNDRSFGAEKAGAQPGTRLDERKE